MRAVTGSVVSSDPISLRRAAAIISKFAAAAATGARPETVAYVRCASKAFNELVQFHGELKSGHRITDGDDGHDKKPSKETAAAADGPLCVAENGVAGMEKKRKRREGKEEQESGKLDRGNEEEVGLEKLTGSEERKKKREKKRNQEAFESNGKEEDVKEEKLESKKKNKRDQEVNLAEEGGESETRKKDKKEKRSDREIAEQGKVKDEKEVDSREENSTERRKKKKKKNEEGEFEEGRDVDRKKRKHTGVEENGGRELDDHNGQHKKKKRKMETEG